MNKWDIVITIVLVCVLTLAIRKIIRDKRSGKCSCGCCEGCKGCRKSKTMFWFYKF